MTIKKENNQYYAKYIEMATEAYINGTEVKNETGFIFTSEELEIMNDDAKNIAKALNGKKAKYIGSSTSKESGDLIIDGEIIELKYVGSKESSGTYFNTSIYYNDTLGFTSFKEYLKKSDCKFLEPFFGKNVYKNNSPVTIELSKYFRHNYIKEYKKLQDIDRIMRKEYRDNFFNFLLANPDKKNIFISDLISKSPAGKNIPNKMVVYCYKDDKIKIFTKDDLVAMKDNKNFTLSGNDSIKAGNVRFTFAWQNGTGLNNPTIRVFI